MTGSQRWVVVAAAPPRRPWFRDVASWSTNGLLPVDVVKCLSAPEIAARLDGGRAYSAVVLAEDLPGLDRDLVSACAAAGCAVIVVGDLPHRAAHLGATASLPAQFDAPMLAATLHEHASPVQDVPAALLDPTRAAPLPLGGRLIAVLGPAGCGASTIAAALARGLHAPGTDVVLADLALHADQALLHLATDVVPAVTELVDAARSGPLTEVEVHGCLQTPPNAPYRLLVGLRRHRDWAALRPAATDAAIDALRQTHAWVVADVDADLEGVDTCGSHDVEDRNHLARRAATVADLAVVVVRAEIRSLRRLATLAEDLAACNATRPLLPVVNGAPRHPRRRAEVHRAITDLIDPAIPVAPTAFIPYRRQMARLAHDGLVGACPPVPTTIAGAAIAAIEHLPFGRHQHDEAPARITPGTLGTWFEEAAG